VVRFLIATASAWMRPGKSPSSVHARMESGSYEVSGLRSPILGLGKAYHSAEHLAWLGGRGIVPRIAPASSLASAWTATAGQTLVWLLGYRQPCQRPLDEPTVLA
jgi:hypothetical protein